MKITFVAFYVEVTTETMTNVHKRTPSITVTDPHRFTEIMFASATHFHPNCRRVVLTDHETSFPFGTDIDIIRLDLDPTQPMMARSTAWLGFLAQADTHVVFLDSDILINANLDHIFSSPFDVALTYRDDEKWPINAGINFVHGHHLANGQAFHQLWVNHYQQVYHEQGVWGGDQDALRDLLDEADFSRNDLYLHRQHNLTVQLLPCQQYNFSTADQFGMTGHYPDKQVLHFKGRRKSDMLPYWESYIKDWAINKFRISRRNHNGSSSQS